MHTIRASIMRTRFSKEIIAEFLVPAKKTDKVIILANGMPSYPGRRDDLIQFLGSQGFWVILPRYRGSWESGGSFLEESPHKDLLDIIDQLPEGFVDLWNNDTYRIRNPKVFIVGSSFGGAAALLVSKNPRVKKVVVLSPVTDWRVESRVESVDWVGRFTQIAFGNGYRMKPENWNKLKTGRFYNPITQTSLIKGEKIMVFHAEDDQVVYYSATKAFCKKTKAKLVPLKTGGHLSISNIVEPFFWTKIKAFLK